MPSATRRRSGRSRPGATIYLRDAGYHCWATGKLDLTLGVDYGFEQTRMTHGHSQHPDITSLFRTPVCFRSNERNDVNGKFTERADPDAGLARNAIQFIRERGSKSPGPFTSACTPHPKWVAEKMPMPDIPAGYVERRHTMFQVLANASKGKAIVKRSNYGRAPG